MKKTMKVKVRSIALVHMFVALAAVGIVQRVLLNRVFIPILNQFFTAPDGLEATNIETVIRLEGLFSLAVTAILLVIVSGGFRRYRRDELLFATNCVTGYMVVITLAEWVVQAVSEHAVYPLMVTFYALRIPADGYRAAAELITANKVWSSAALLPVFIVSFALPYVYYAFCAWRADRAVPED